MNLAALSKYGCTRTLASTRCRIAHVRQREISAVRPGARITTQGRRYSIVGVTSPDPAPRTERRAAAGVRR